MVPDGWEIRKMEDVLERVADPVAPQPEQEYRQIGIRSHGKGIFHKDPVTGAELGNKRVFKIYPDCFVVNIVFAWEQAVARTTENEVGMIASHRFPMYKPKNGMCDIDWLNYYFKTKRGKYLLELASPGGAGRNKTLGQKEFARLQILMPRGCEQRKIAKILSTWDKAIETVEKLIENSRAQAKSLSQQLLSGKLYFPRNTDHWRNGTLSDLCDFRGGSGFNQAFQGKQSGDIPFIKVSDMNLPQNRRYITTANNWISENEAVELRARPFEPGSIVFAKVGAALLLNRRRILLRETIIDNNMMAAIPKPECDSKFLYYLMLEIDFAKLVQEGAIPSVNQSDLARVKINIIPLEEQKAIADVLFSADKHTEHLEARQFRIQKEKQALMQQLLTGKRRVKPDPSNKDAIA